MQRIPQRIPHPRLPRPGRRPARDVAPDVSGEYAFGRGELAAIAAALRVRLRDRSRPIASPDELRRAIEDACGTWRSSGSVEVHRIPGALHTAESWHLRLDSVRPEARQLVESLIAEARGVR